MTEKQKTQKMFVFVCGAFLSLVSTASQADTSAPFYFSDHAGNVQGLYTDTRCNGVSGCKSFGRFCGTDFYSNSYAIDSANKTWQYKGFIGIRQNSGSYPVVCELKK